MPASWPAPVGSTGAPSSADTRRSRNPGWKSTTGDTDSAVTTTPVPSREDRSDAWRVIAASNDSSASPEAARASSHAVTRDGTALVPFGSTVTRPNVARAPASRACLFAASAVIAYDSIGSRRSVISVVPAWFASPVNSNRYRPCGQIELATPTGAPPSTSPRPCSTCSSTKVVIRSTNGDGPTAEGSAPHSRSAERSVVPDRSVSDRARSAGNAPTATRDPRQGIPNRDPSSSTKAPTPIGTRGPNPAARSRSTATSADTTPSGPSKAPPSITESRWLPVTTPGPSGPHQATWLPIPSVSIRRPRERHWSVNQAVASRSDGVQPPRL